MKKYYYYNNIDFSFIQMLKMNPLYIQQLLEIDQQQQQNSDKNAFSKALAAIAQAAAQQPQDPWGSSKKKSLMRSFGTAIPAGVQAYQKHEDDIRAEQRQALEKAWGMQKAEEEQMWNRQKTNEQLDIQKHYLALAQLREKKELEKEQREQEKEERNQRLLAQGFTPIGDGDKEAEKMYRKQTYDLMNKLPNYDNVIKATNNIDRIIKKWDKKGIDIATEYAGIVSSVGQKDKTGFFGKVEDILTSALRRNANPEMINDLQLIEKNSNILVANEIQGLGGGRTTDMMKRIFVQSTAGKGMKNQAALAINAETRDLAKKKKKYALERRKVQSLGFELNYAEPDIIENEDVEITEPSTSVNSSSVKMRFPDGSVRYAPAGEIDRYAQMGGTLVQ